MQRRVLAAAMVFLCASSVAASAQLMPLQDDPTWGPRIRVTPYAGYLPAVDRPESWVHNSGPGTQNTFVDVNYHLASGNAFGILGEVTMHGPWNAFAGVMYGSRGESQFDLVDSGEEFQINGSRFIFTRIGASLTLREKQSELTLRRLSASVFAAPFYMREMPRAELGFGGADVFSASNHFGLNLGVSGELPFAQDRMSLQLGVEDYATWFSSDALQRLPDAFFNDNSPGASTRVETNVAHQWLLRAGLSYRWR
jgi:hypothetical protein